MIPRREEVRVVRRLLRQFPVVGLLGARQVGKTTLARLVAGSDRATRFDLESEAAVRRLEDPEAALQPLRGLVILDEIQRRPNLFPTLRVLADRPRRPASFLILGSASPALLRQSSESLAGRIAHHELGGLRLGEVGAANWARLWLRGGFPRSYAAAKESDSFRWRQEFVRTFFERELPGLGLGIPAGTLARFWKMLAHYHGRIWNASEFARSFGMTDMSVRRYLDLLSAAYLIRLLPPWHANLGKRQVKAPKVYVRDSGLLHAILPAPDRAALHEHPQAGASWEGFALQQVVASWKADWEDCYFWATHGGAELDLLIRRGRAAVGFEFKYSANPGVTTSMRVAVADLNLDRLYVVHPGNEGYRLADRIEAAPLRRVLGRGPGG